MLYKSLNFDRFRDEFIRLDRGNQFSYEGLQELFDYYENFDEPVEFDVIGICCDWCEVDEKPSDDFYLETSIGTFLVQA